MIFLYFSKAVKLETQSEIENSTTQLYHVYVYEDYRITDG